MNNGNTRSQKQFAQLTKQNIKSTNGTGENI